MNKKTNFGTAFVVVLLLIGGLLIFNNKDNPTKKVCDLVKSEFIVHFKDEGLNPVPCKANDIVQKSGTEFEYHSYATFIATGEKGFFKCDIKFRENNRPVVDCKLK